MAYQKVEIILQHKSITYVMPIIGWVPVIGSVTLYVMFAMIVIGLFELCKNVQAYYFCLGQLLLCICVVMLQYSFLSIEFLVTRFLQSCDIMRKRLIVVRRLYIYQRWPTQYIGLQHAAAVNEKTITRNELSSLTGSVSSFQWLSMKYYTRQLYSFSISCMNTMQKLISWKLIISLRISPRRVNYIHCESKKRVPPYPWL